MLISFRFSFLRTFLLPLAVLLSLGLGRVSPDLAPGSDPVMPVGTDPVEPSSADFSTSDAEERCLDHACFKTRRSVSGQVLSLRGISNRDFLWARVYSLAFYERDPNARVDRGVPEGAKMIVMEYHRSVEKQRIIDNIIENVANNPDVEIEEVRDRFNDLTRAFDSPKDGDRYEFLFVPGEGTSLIRDETIRVTIPGEDFAFAFFGIWLSSHTGDQGRRMQLLGERAG